MMMWLLFVFALISCSFALVIDHPDSTFTQKSEWIKIERSNPDKEIKLYFALRNENVDLLEKLLLAVSTPGNPEYGNHRTLSSLRKMISPSQTAINSILNWLGPQTKIESTNKDLMSLVMTISEAERLLNCQYYDYLSQIDKTTVVSRVEIGTDYNLEASIGKHLYFVMPTHRFPLLRSRLKVYTITAGQQTPGTLRALYNVGDAKGSVSNNSQGIASFQHQLYDIKDTQKMWQENNLSPCNVTNIPNDTPTGHGIEAELDTQYISSMGQGISMQVWWNKGEIFLDSLMEWTENVLNSTNAPPLFSISYGGTESDFGAAYINKINIQFMQMGTAGISLIWASGDSGAGGGCIDGKYQPDFPPSSPYVTAVGGLEGGTAGQNPLGESSWLFGGGGFSNYAVTQPWQTDAVSYYLKNERDLPDQSKYNATGRGYPDIAAQSVDFLIYVDGLPMSGSGTSCSAPTAGGIIALLNDLRTANKMSKLGFANPFIYQTAAKDPTAFNDCTQGFNQGCTTSPKGFPAFEKWDPSSGYGSPNYAVLSKEVIETGKQTVKWNV